MIMINTVVNENNEDAPRKQQDLHKIIPKFDSKAGDISLYLVLFERQARMAFLNQESWVSHLLGLLPYEITQLIAREPEELSNNYDHIKGLLLKKFKLSPEKFRQRFVQNQRQLNSTWRDFAFELKTFLEEWITGLGITTFDELKELMITEQLKSRVPVEVRDHFIDDWCKIVSTRNLTDKLDDYESVRGNRKIKEFRPYQTKPMIGNMSYEDQTQ